MVIRKLDQTDLRSFGLELTMFAKDAIEEHLEAETAIFGGVLDRLNEEEQKEIVRIMSKIAEGFNDRT